MSSSTAVVLAAHGAGDGSAANTVVHELARRLNAELPERRIAVAFQRGAPHFREVLDELEASEVTVIPLLAADGYFTRERLPRELAENRTSKTTDITITAPVGSHPRLRRALVARTGRRLRALPHGQAETDLLVVGHGTAAHPASATTTLELARELATSFPAARVRAAFLDQQPWIPAVLAELDRPQLLVLPFLFGGGRHAAEDVPALVQGHAPMVAIEGHLASEPALLDVLTRLATGDGSAM